MKIKLFEGNDLDKCTDTFMQVFNHDPWNDAWTKETATQYILDFTNTPGFMGIVAKDGEEIIGIIFGIRKRWWSGDEFFINEMCVNIEKQHTGVGSRLINYLIKELESDGVRTISLLTNRGIPAETFYKKNGFSEIKRLMFLSRDIKLN